MKPFSVQHTVLSSHVFTFDILISCPSAAFARTSLINSIHRLENTTCVLFIPRTSEQDYVLFKMSTRYVSGSNYYTTSNITVSIEGGMVGNRIRLRSNFYRVLELIVIYIHSDYNAICTYQINLQEADEVNYTIREELQCNVIQLIMDK